MLNGVRRTSRQKGFTLVEALVAVGVLAVLASLAAPSFESTFVRFRVRVSAEGLMSGLQLARSEALRRNQPVRFTLDDGRGNWTVATLSPARTIQTSTGAAAAGVTLTTNASQTAVVFLASGLVDTSAARIERIDLSTRVPGVNTWRVEVHGGGQVRMCDPAVTDANDRRKC